MWPGSGEAGLNCGAGGRAFADLPCMIFTSVKAEVSILKRVKIWKRQLVNTFEKVKEISVF